MDSLPSQYARLLSPLIYLLNKLLSECKQSKVQRLTTAIGLSLIILGVFVNEPTTNGVFKIHADLPCIFIFNVKPVFP